MTELAEALFDAVGELPEEQVFVLADALRGMDRPTREVGLILQDLHAAPGFRAHAGAIADGWIAESPGVPGAGLALSLEALLKAERARVEQRLEAVWTGPALEIVDCRATRAVQLALVQKAEQSITLMTFNATDEELLDALNDANARGVEVKLIAETVGFDHDPMPVFNRLHRGVKLYEWLAESREQSGAYIARLHAKVLMADAKRALVTSANLSRAAALKNIEIGVLVTGGPFPAELAAQVDQLIAVDVLTRARRPNGGW